MRNLSLKIVAPIRTELRVRRITIKQFSKMLNVSEPTTKRWLNAKGLLLDDWTKMLDVLGLNPIDVMAKSNLASNLQFEYTIKQEDAFVEIPGLLAFFQHALEGHSAEQIASDHKLSKSVLSFYLKILHEIGLIRWRNGFEFSLVHSGEPKWRKHGALSKLFRNQVVSELIYTNKDSNKLRLGIYHLTKTDIEKLKEKLDIAFEFAKQSENRAKLMFEKSETIGLATICTQYRPDFLYVIPNKKTVINK